MRQNAIFLGILFFKAMNDTKTNNLAAAGWVLPEECVHKTNLQQV